MSRISPQGNWLHCVAEDSHLYCFEMVRSATYIYTYPALCSARPPLTGACRTQPQGKLEHLLKAHAYTHVRAHTCIRICTHAHAHAHAHRRRASWSTCSRLMTRTSLASPSILIAISSPRGQTRGHSSCGAPSKARRLPTEALKTCTCVYVCVYACKRHGAPQGAAGGRYMHIHIYTYTQTARPRLGLRGIRWPAAPARAEA